MFVGARRDPEESGVDEWISERGLDDEDLHALATGLGDELREAAETVEETADDEGGKVTAGRLRRLLGGGA